MSKYHQYMYYRNGKSLKFMYRKTLVTLLLLPLFETIEDF